MQRSIYYNGVRSKQRCSDAYQGEQNYLDVAKSIWYDIILALQTAKETISMSHNDIKPSNVLIKKGKLSYVTTMPRDTLLN